MWVVETGHRVYVWMAGSRHSKARWVGCTQSPLHVTHTAHLSMLGVCVSTLGQGSSQQREPMN